MFGNAKPSLCRVRGNGSTKTWHPSVPYSIEAKISPFRTFFLHFVFLSFFLAFVMEVLDIQAVHHEIDLHQTGNCFHILVVAKPASS